MDNNFLKYNCLDAACMVEIRDGFWDQMREEGYGPAYNMTLALLPVITFMQTRGVRVNMEEMSITKKDILRQIDLKQEQLNKLCGRALNVNSPKDCQTYFYIEKGAKPYYRDGRITVDDTALQRLVRGTTSRPGFPEAKLIQDIRGLRKLYGTYLDIEFDSDGRMRCSYNPRGTKFGRLSSSATILGTGTNMQNLPQEFKRFVVADDGYVLWEVDKRQAEWVVVAYLCQDANMLSVVESGRDTHVHTASLMFNCEPEIVEKENKLVGMLTDPDRIAELRQAAGINVPGFPRAMSARQCGKKSNHGLNYDEGPNQFALINELEVAEGRRIVEMYHTICYPGIRIWYEWVKRKLQSERFLVNCFGRKVRFMDAWGPDLWKAAYSMLPQSTVVDSLNQGMVKIYNDLDICSTKGFNVDILAQVHDSILMQVPIEWVADLSTFKLLVDKVYDYVSPDLTYHGRSFKIATDMKLGRNWGGFHPEDNPFGMQEVKQLEQVPKLLEHLGV